MNFDFARFAVWYLAFLFSTTVHEAAHAWWASRSGDRTAKDAGHVTLDPTPHVLRSPIGMILIPLYSFYETSRMGSPFLMGWASVPFDPDWARRHPRQQALMSLAGPAANLVLALIALIALRALLAAGVFVAPNEVSFSQLVALNDGRSMTGPLGAVAVGLSVMLNLNVLLGLFNLLPIPPLDGAGILEGFASDSVRPIFDKFREMPFLQLLGLVIAWKVFPFLYRPVWSLALALVHPHFSYV